MIYIPRIHFLWLWKEGEEPTRKYMDEYKFAFDGLMQEKQLRQFISD